MEKGFTLIELLVVVLIIGILAAVALPQYQVAVEKARIAQILPMMRHIYDAFSLYKLQAGSYYVEGQPPTWDELGIEPPTGFDVGSTPCVDFTNDNWYCQADDEGGVGCFRLSQSYSIAMYQPNTHSLEFAGKRICSFLDDSGEKICKTLGGTRMEAFGGDEIVYVF